MELGLSQHLLPFFLLHLACSPLDTTRPARAAPHEPPRTSQARSVTPQEPGPRYWAWFQAGADRFVTYEFVPGVAPAAHPGLFVATGGAQPETAFADVPQAEVRVRTVQVPTWECGPNDEEVLNTSRPNLSIRIVEARRQKETEWVTLVGGQYTTDSDPMRLDGYRDLGLSIAGSIGTELVIVHKEFATYPCGRGEELAGVTWYALNGPQPQETVTHIPDCADPDINYRFQQMEQEREQEFGEALEGEAPPAWFRERVGIFPRPDGQFSVLIGLSGMGMVDWQEVESPCPPARIDAALLRTPPVVQAFASAHRELRLGGFSRL